MRQAHPGVYHYGGLKQRLLVLRGEIFFFVPFEQSVQISAALFSVGMCKQGADDAFKSIFYPFCADRSVSDQAREYPTAFLPRETGWLSLFREDLRRPEVPSYILH